LHRKSLSLFDWTYRELNPADLAGGSKMPTVQGAAVLRDLVRVVIAELV